jgi:hypothetical protein
MPGRSKSAYRTRLFKAIHAEGVKHGFDHDALRDWAKNTHAGVKSMADLTDGQLLGMYKSLTGGKTLRRYGKLAGRGEMPSADSQLVSTEDLASLDQEFVLAGFDAITKLSLIRRQLNGREVIRTRGDLVRVAAAVRAIRNRSKKAC